MNWIVSIFRMANSNWTSRIFTLVLILLGTYSATQIFTAKAKAKCEDCTPYQKIAEDLIDAFKGKETAFEPAQSSYRYALFIDTVPKTKWERYRDSVIIHNQKKLDSLKKQKSKT